MPVPLVDHITDAWLLAEPLTDTAGELVQELYGPPALAVGAGTAVTMTEAHMESPQELCQRA